MKHGKMRESLPYKPEVQQITFHWPFFMVIELYRNSYILVRVQFSKNVANDCLELADVATLIYLCCNFLGEFEPLEHIRKKQAGLLAQKATSRTWHHSELYAQVLQICVRLRSGSGSRKRVPIKISWYAVLRETEGERQREIER